MIIRKDVTVTQKASPLNSRSARRTLKASPLNSRSARRTLKASPLNSRAVRSTPGYDKCTASTLKRSPAHPDFSVSASTALAYQKTPALLALPALLAPNSSRSLLSDTQRPIVARRHSPVCPKPWDFCPRPWDFCPKPWDKSGKPGFFTIPEVLGASSVV